MRCLGRTRTLRRCSRSARFLFCHDHFWPSIVSLIVAIGIVAGLYQDLLKSALCNFFSRDARPPEVKVSSGPVNLPEQNDGPLPLADIMNRRLHTMEIRNPNAAPLSNVELSTQFPEAILTITPQDSAANQNIQSVQDWDKQPLTIAGNAAGSYSIEPFVLDEYTGLWRVRIDTIPGNRAIKVEFVTAIGKEGGLYSEAVVEAESAKSNDEVMWLIQGTYEYSKCSEAIRRKLFVPLAFDRKSRSLTVVTAISDEIDSGNRVYIRQGHGCRMPGIFQTRGYVVIKSRAGTRYSSPVLLERTEGVDVRFGLFGSPPTNPGFIVQVFDRSSPALK